jgi:hypothetical protein
VVAWPLPLLLDSDGALFELFDELDELFDELDELFDELLESSLFALRESSPDSPLEPLSSPDDVLDDEPLSDVALDDVPLLAVVVRLASVASRATTANPAVAATAERASPAVSALARRLPSSRLVIASSSRG